MNLFCHPGERFWSLRAFLCRGTALSPRKLSGHKLQESSACSLVVSSAGKLPRSMHPTMHASDRVKQHPLRKYFYPQCFSDICRENTGFLASDFGLAPSSASLQEQSC